MVQPSGSCSALDCSPRPRREADQERPAAGGREKGKVNPHHPHSLRDERPIRSPPRVVGGAGVGGGGGGGGGREGDGEVGGGEVPYEKVGGARREFCFDPWYRVNIKILLSDEMAV